MVKNTIGGKKGKMLSKKQNSTNNGIFPISMDENEIYVCVIKIFGGGVFEVIDQNNKKYKAFLRGKMKGSNKRHNLVSIYSILLVGIRIDFSDKSAVDILFVYENHHIQTLCLNSHFPNSLLLYSQGNNNNIGTRGDSEKIDDSFVFSDNINNNNNNNNNEKKMDLKLSQSQSQSQSEFMDHFLDNDDAFLQFI